MNINKSLYSGYINQIPTKLRAKYIAIFKTKKNPDIDIIAELKSLITLTNQQNLPKITYPDLPVSDKVEQIKKNLSKKIKL